MSQGLTAGAVLREPVEIFAPNPDALAIIKLHLQRLPEMTEEERRVFLRVTEALTFPPILVTDPDRPPRARG